MAKRKPGAATKKSDEGSRSNVVPVVAAFSGAMISSALLTLALVNAIVIEPLKEEVNELRESSVSEPITRDTEDQSREPAAGVLAVRFLRERYHMLMVIQESEQVGDQRIYFSPPAGGLKAGENVPEGAVREAGEETGLSFKPSDRQWKSPSGNSNFWLVHCEVSDGPVSSPTFNEAYGFAWVEPKSLPNRYWRYPDQRDWVVKCFEEAVDAMVAPNSP